MNVYKVKLYQNGILYDNVDVLATNVVTAVEKAEAKYADIEDYKMPLFGRRPSSCWRWT